METYFKKRFGAFFANKNEKITFQQLNCIMIILDSITVMLKTSRCKGLGKLMDFFLKICPPC